MSVQFGAGGSGVAVKTPTRNFTVQRPLHVRGEQLQRRILGQTADMQCRQSVEHTRNHFEITDHEQQRDPVGLQSPRDKGQRLNGVSLVRAFR